MVTREDGRLTWVWEFGHGRFLGFGFAGGVFRGWGRGGVAVDELEDRGELVVDVVAAGEFGAFL